MATFLVERYIAAPRLETVAATARAGQRAAARMRAEGTPVRYVRSLWLPSDETCLCLFEAPSLDAVQAANRGDGLAYMRIVEVAELLPDGQERAVKKGGSDG